MNLPQLRNSQNAVDKLNTHANFFTATVVFCVNSLKNLKLKFMKAKKVENNETPVPATPIESQEFQDTKDPARYEQVEITADVEKSTDKAVMFKFKKDGLYHKVWLPKSQLIIVNGKATCARWLHEKSFK